ncbi:glycoside hydrolase family 5 protein [Abortiporus biennis]|nr:glycoside hydrolase family 5 protein [Abortiporus biennis]
MSRQPTDLESSYILVEESQDNSSSPRKSYAHDWSPEATGGKISIHGRHFVDAHGRVCNLRGVNLSGNCKSPVNHDHDIFPHIPEPLTFVGRPFPLEEAPQHLARLRRWGLTFVRFLVTWEAVEHLGPGKYDTEYLSYVRSLLSLFPQYGIVAFVALHQDVWSRFSGGSGAPSWTLESVGFDLHALEESGAAWLQGIKGGGHVEHERGLWPCGYQKLAAATMSTCFWAGDTFAPKLKVKNEQGVEVSIQTFLQTAFLNMFEQVAKAVGDLPAVIGFEMMNEPHRGYIDLKSMHRFDPDTDLHLGHVPTAFQSFLLGAGYATRVAHYARGIPPPTRLSHYDILNESKKKVWRDDGPTGGKCLWELHGVWGWDKVKDEGVVLREGYFSRDPASNKEVDWYTDYYYPFLNKWSQRMQSVSSPDKFIFTEPIPNEFCPTSWTKDHQPKNMVFAPHWYDLYTLFNKAFGEFNVNVQGLSRGMFLPKALYWGQLGTRQNYSLQIKNLVEAGYRSLGEVPVVIGECGIPMDMSGGAAFESEDWTYQNRMMDAMITGLENAMVGFTLWNYNPSNDDQAGDDWNGENFSWFSNRRALPPSLLTLSDQTSPTLDNGGRILRSIVRPYPSKISGIPLKFQYEVNTGDFSFTWVIPHAKDIGDANIKGEPRVDQPPQVSHPPLKSNVTEIFLPSLLAHGSKIHVSGLSPKDSWTYDESVQTLYISVDKEEGMIPGKVHQVNVILSPRLRPLFALNDVWSDFSSHVVAAMGILIALVAYFVLGFI